ncbi:MAG TPA: FixH family protein [Bryobacteraceae bacterium]|jgi:hypothetical protein
MRQPKKLRLSANLVFVLALLAGCQERAAGEFQIECKVEPQPPRVGAANVQIALTDSRHAPVRGAQISLEADMSHPGMKPQFKNASAAPDGSYHAKLNFDMPGDWILLLHAKLANGKTADDQVRLTVLEK